MEFSTNYRKASSRGGCCVENCSSKMQINTNLSFHRIPERGTTKIERRNLFNNVELVDKHDEWTRRLNIKSDSKQLFVCSLHFNESDYYLPGIDSKTRRLRKDAVPEAMETQKKSEHNTKRKIRQEKRHLKESVVKNTSIKGKADSAIENVDANVNSIASCSYTCNEEDVHENSTCEYEEPDFHDTDCEDSYAEESNDGSEMAHIMQEEQETSADVHRQIRQPTMADKCVQVASGDFGVSFCSFIQSEKNLVTMCNIKSFAILNQLVELIDTYYPKKRQFIMNTHDCILLTTAKLKLDISFAALACFFRNISVVTVANIFYDTVQRLARILEATITRVSKEEIERNMPKCFQNFKSTTSVMDCTEIQIQQPKCLKCRIKFYSHYKGHATVKYMTEVTPAGIIVGISEAFGGRASDNSIFNHTGTLNYLESTRDAIMVDKGFLIDNECSSKRIKLIRPPFLRKKDQLTEEEARENRDIASARVHIERMNQRIKQFKIISNTYPWHMIDYIDDVFLICCGLANLGSPILADDKF